MFRAIDLFAVSSMLKLSRIQYPELTQRLRVPGGLDIKVKKSSSACTMRLSFFIPTAGLGALAFLAGMSCFRCETLSLGGGGHFCGYARLSFAPALF